MSQLISLVRYQSAAVLNLRLLAFLFVVLTGSFLASQFIAELALINRQSIGLAAFVEMARYCLVFWLLVQVCFQVNQDYELAQFDWILALPVARYQYLLSQVCQIIVLSAVAASLVFFSLLAVANLQVALIWSLSLLLELILTGHIALLAAVSLRKLPLAVLFAFAIYLLARVAPLIIEIMEGSLEFYLEERVFLLGYYLFSVMHYLLPSSEAFASSDFLFAELSGARLWSQFLQVFVYSGLLLLVTMIDFYRKEMMP